MKLDDLTPHAAQLAALSTAWLDRFWDEDAGLILFPSDYTMEQARTPEVAPPGVKHGVRETGSYVVGLLLRDAEGDRGRACRALRRIVQFQFDEPGAVYHGTFYRYPEETPPGNAPTI
jgi:hypothetical protein